MESKRAISYALKLIRKYQIDLKGLVVLTEAASNAYLYNPMIAMLAGADHVLTYCRDSSYGSAVDIYTEMRDAYAEVGIQNQYEELTNLSSELIATADIVTNSGHVRPFDNRFISAMKATAVIPLMWEPWEFREGELDIEAAKRRGILVLGTNEHEPPCNMKPFSLLTAIKLLMDHQAAIIDDRILIIGNQATLAVAIEEGLNRVGLDCRRVDTHSTQAEFSTALEWASYILVAEHSDHRQIIGNEGLINIPDLIAAGINAVGVMAGLVDKNALEEQGISVFPKRLASHGYLSYQPSALGPYPVMDLFAAGLKVGAVAANARKNGMNTAEAMKHAQLFSPALDLTGDYAWIKK